MEWSGQVKQLVARLEQALAAAQSAEERANARTSAADSMISDARAWIAAAEAQAVHAGLRLDAANAHMAAAKTQMGDANARVESAVADQACADVQMASAAALVAAENEDSLEYQRALDHYQLLVRHRIANPLVIIKGLAHALQHQPGLGAAQRRTMLRRIEEQAIAMERMSLFAAELETEAERGLRPAPFT
jgi:chromosome segregation ATPase